MRFSLRTLLLATGIAGLFSYIFFAAPAFVVDCVLLSLLALMPGVLVALIVYGRGNVRAFAIGAIASFASLPIGLFIHSNISENGLNHLDNPLVAVSTIARPQQVSDNAGEEFATNLKIEFAVQIGVLLGSGLASIGIRWLCRRALKPDTPPETNRNQSSHSLSIEPRDKAELYTILQGRVTAAGGVSANDSAMVGH